VEKRNNNKGSIEGVLGVDAPTRGYRNNDLANLDAALRQLERELRAAVKPGRTPADSLEALAGTCLASEPSLGLNGLLRACRARGARLRRTDALAILAPMLAAHRDRLESTDAAGPPKPIGAASRFQ
jgi:hypothetical protein